MSSKRPEPLPTESGRPALPSLVGHLIWSRLPSLLLLDLAVAVAATPTIVFMLSGGHVVTPLVAGLTLGPVWAATVATTDRIVRDDDVSVRAFFAAVRQHSWTGVRLGLVAGAVGSMTLGTLAIWRDQPDERWLLVPLFVDGSISVLVGVASLALFSLSTTHQLRGWSLWLMAWQLAARHPMMTGGSVALFVVLLVLLTWLPSAAFVLPGPGALYLSALVWEWTERE